MKRVLVCGAGGFIGSHLVRHLKREGHRVEAADLHLPSFGVSLADDFLLGDLRDKDFCARVFRTPYDEIYQLAADMGGAGYIFSGLNDAQVMHNSAMINLNVLDALRSSGAGRVFYASSACIYPEHNQRDPRNPLLAEESAYPANPDSEYGWEKLFSERMYLAFHRNHGVDVRIARLHNVFGPEGAWNDGREKAIAAICRKVAAAEDGGSIDVWGDGEQTRSFLYIDDCIDGITRLVRGDWVGPVNIGSEEMLSINALAAMVIEISGKRLSIRNVSGPTGVRGRRSDNRLAEARIGWRPKVCLVDGVKQTYSWISGKVREQAGIGSPVQQDHVV